MNWCYAIIDIIVLIITNMHNLNMGLSSQVVYFRWFRRVDDVHQAVAIDQVPIVEDHLPLKHYNGVDQITALFRVG